MIQQVQGTHSEEPARETTELFVCSCPLPASREDVYIYQPEKVTQQATNHSFRCCLSFLDKRPASGVTRIHEQRESPSQAAGNLLQRSAPVFFFVFLEDSLACAQLCRCTGAAAAAAGAPSGKINGLAPLCYFVEREYAPSGKEVPLGTMLSVSSMLMGHGSSMWSWLVQTKSELARISAWRGASMRKVDQTSVSCGGCMGIYSHVWC